MVGILRGGGVDCANLTQTTATDTTTETASTANATTKTGKWIRISSFKSWIDATIQKELAPGRKTTVTFHDITMITRCIKQPKN